MTNLENPTRVGLIESIKNRAFEVVDRLEKVELLAHSAPAQELRFLSYLMNMSQHQASIVHDLYSRGEVEENAAQNLE